MESTSVTSKEQVTIPKDIRQKLGIRTGSRVEFRLVEDHVEMRVSHWTAEVTESGLDFADALHHASYRDCESMATFDDRKFSRRARKLGLTPVVIVPA